MGCDFISKDCDDHEISTSSSVCVNFCFGCCIRYNNLYNSSLPDKMAVSNTLGTFTAQFVSGVMYSQYQSSSVPAGWLIPLTYINIGRFINEGDELARVNLIVPHSQGTVTATANVYPCFYELTYERGI